MLKVEIANYDFFIEQKRNKSLFSLDSEGVILQRERERGRHPIEITSFSHITVQMLDGTVFHGYLVPYGHFTPEWIQTPRLDDSQYVDNPIRAYVRMSNGRGFSTVLREQDVLGQAGPPAPLVAVSSIVRLQNGTSSRAVLRFCYIRNNVPVQFSTSGTSIFVGFPEGLVFTGMFEEIY